MEDKTMNKNLLVIIPMGGLANRMRAITSGITLAKAAKFKSKVTLFQQQFSLEKALDR